ncbi:MAG: hypothetical protein KDC05_10890 [Bacteroidales bacterium]|nr:hypothetical protein [Bacteroidales bacterium]
MKRIEDKIKDNLNLLNAEEPDSSHLERFSDKLDRFHATQHENWFQRNELVLKMAAALAIFITIGTLLYTGTFSRWRTVLTEQIVAAELPAEVREVMQYYNVITEQKVEEIDKLAISQDEADRVKKMALAELKDLELARLELEKEYTKQPGNERIMNAMLANQQRKSEILDKILHTLNQVN